MEIGASTLAAAYTQVTQAVKPVSTENEVSESPKTETSESRQTQMSEGEVNSNNGRIDVYV